MNKIDSFEEAAWIDFFSKTDFQGRLHRLRLRLLDNPARFRQSELPKFQSMIVGPGVVAEFHLHGRSQPIRLQPKTILTDASRRLNGNRVHSLLLASKD